jgi:hypothetical protein
MGESLGLGVVLIILGAAWVFLLLWMLRPPTPRFGQLMAFVLLLGVSAVLGYIFYTKVLDKNPNPIKVQLARFISEDKFIYLGDFVPGLYDLDYIYRLDTDGETEEIKEEWVTFYQYDVSTAESGVPLGPFGGAVYDYGSCRPPAVQSYELVPVSYDYLAQNTIDVAVDNIIAYGDPVSGGVDRPELIVSGLTHGVVTDLNIFRKTGIGLDCIQLQDWQAKHPGEAFPNPFRYASIGSFRGNYLVQRQGSTVTVVDRAPFERSQITIRRQYRPENGSYYRAGTQILLNPVEYGLAFEQGLPDEVVQVYYPEKAVLAFYLNLTQDEKQLQEANGYLSTDAQAIFDIETDYFGLAMPRDELARVLVLEIRYEPNIEAEQLHEERQVTVTVVGVDKAGNIDWNHPCQVTWGVIGAPKVGALPYGCEWRLDWYQSSCPPPASK